MRDPNLPDRTIQNLDTGTSSAIEFPGWYSSLDHAWWGAETQGTISAHGVPAGQSNQNMAYMGYSSNISSSMLFRSGLTCADVWKSFTWDGSSNNNGCNGTRHGHVGNWVYGGDKLAPETH